MEIEKMSKNLSLKAFVVLMKSSKSVIDQIERDIRTYGMTTSDFTVLEALFHKGKLTVRQISNAVLIKTGSITYVIDKLETKGLLKRKPCQKDRRVVYIELTKEGKQLMDHIFPKHRAVIENIFSVLTKEEKKIMIDALKKVGQKGVY